MLDIHSVQQAVDRALQVRQGWWQQRQLGRQGPAACSLRTTVGVSDRPSPHATLLLCRLPPTGRGHQRAGGGGDAAGPPRGAQPGPGPQDVCHAGQGAPLASPCLFGLLPHARCRTMHAFTFIHCFPTPPASCACPPSRPPGFHRPGHQRAQGGHQDTVGLVHPPARLPARHGCAVHRGVVQGAGQQAWGTAAKQRSAQPAASPISNQQRAERCLPASLHCPPGTDACKHVLMRSGDPEESVQDAVAKVFHRWVGPPLAMYCFGPCCSHCAAGASACGACPDPHAVA